IGIVLASAIAAGCAHDAATAPPPPPPPDNDSKADGQYAPPNTVEIVTMTATSAASLDLFPSINQSGVIAYRYSPALGTVGVYTDTHGTLATVAEFTGPAFS